MRFLTGYGQRPQHAFGAVGSIAFVFGLAGMINLAVLWLTGVRPIGTRPILMYSVVALLFGAQLASVGILAELFTSYNMSAGTARFYSISDEID